MTGWNNHDDVDFDGSYNFDSEVSTDFYADLDIDSYVDVDVEVEVDVCVEGNSAVFAIDVQSYGNNGATEVNLLVFTNEEYSSITVSGYSVTA